MYLCFAFVFCDTVPSQVRMMISIILKDNVARYWSTMSPEVQQYIMANAPNMLAHPEMHLRQSCATLISVILAQTTLVGWPDLVDNLLAALDSDNAALVHGAFITLGRVCEDHGRELSKNHPELPHQPIDALIPKLLENISSGKEEAIDLSLKCFTYIIPWKPSALLLRIKDFFQVRASFPSLNTCLRTTSTPLESNYRFRPITNPLLLTLSPQNSTLCCSCSSNSQKTPPLSPSSLPFARPSMPSYSVASVLS